ncbi:GAF and ANTAR domain-containing protein [Actinosynnema sp. CS-041913]|uniref:GAF and ANTAR domain-containing protein n=1 Tax=Actinosynnema sp. CS-041913 TaxID=3239917 RepID=UPI003D8F1E15
MGSRRPDEERRGWLWSRVRRLAADEGLPVGTRHVCLTAAAVLAARDVVVYQVADHSRWEPVCVSGPVGDLVSEAQITLGEGPAADCMRDEHPVSASDLTAVEEVARWPVLGPFALSHGVAGILAFPVMMGAVVAGCLEVLRPTPGPPTHREVADGLLLADAATVTLLNAVPPPLGADPFADEVEARWASVHQATGVAAVQLDCDLATAFVRLRAYAYLAGRRLGDVAADVLAHRLEFRAEPDVEPDTRPEAGQG